MHVTVTTARTETQQALQSAISTMRTMQTVPLLASVLKFVLTPLRRMVLPPLRACTSRHAPCSTHKCTACCSISPTAFLFCTVRTSSASPMPMFTEGGSTRLVQCVHSSNGIVPESSCVAPAPASNMSCNMDPCDFCQENVCSGKGTCAGEACRCDPGYSGSYCQVQCCCTPCHLFWRCEPSLHAFSSQMSAIERCVATHCYAHPCLHCCDSKDLATPLVCECMRVCVCVRACA